MYLRSNKVLLKTNSQRGSTTWEYWREQLLKFMVDKFVGNNTRLYHKWKQEDIMSIQKRPFLFPPPHFIKVIGSNNIGSKIVKCHRFDFPLDKFLGKKVFIWRWSWEPMTGPNWPPRINGINIYCPWGRNYFSVKWIERRSIWSCVNKLYATNTGKTNLRKKII